MSAEGNYTRLRLIYGEKNFELVTPTIHSGQLSNYLSAALAGIVLGLDTEQIRSGLNYGQPFDARFEVKKLSSGVTVVNDAYNASFLSMLLALETFASFPAGRRCRNLDYPLYPVLRIQAHGAFGASRLPAREHSGVDFPSFPRNRVYAIDSGIVDSADEKGIYGLTVVISRDSGLRSLYAHLAEVEVSAGQRVSRGQRIGLVGRTGDVPDDHSRFDYVHLHFEIWGNGLPVDPQKHFPTLEQEEPS